MRRVLLLLLILIALFWLFGRVNAQAPRQQQCPVGSYPIGMEKEQLLCKIEPTGCPYGDSIPMDSCDKHAPKPKPKVQADVTPMPVPSVGK